MKNFKIPMTIEEFEVYQVPFGWKDEYSNGFAYITPREHGVMMKIEITKRQIESQAEIRPISEASFEELAKLFYDSFVNSVEYYTQTKNEVKKAAQREINNFFNGRRGIPQFDLSKIAVTDSKKVGASLVSKYKYGFKNEILFVHPKHQGKNIGTALVSSVLNDLDNLGEKIFWSEHHICNELSANWHRKFGFMEETDIMTARFRRNYYRHEVYRNERLGHPEKVLELKLFREKAEAEVERLEKIEDEDFKRAWLSWKYDF